MTPKKTPEQLMKEYNVQPWSPVVEPPDYHTMALLAAQTIPNQTVGELLASADKIEAWLRQPEVDARKMSEDFEGALYKDFYKDGVGGFVVLNKKIHPFDEQKSPEKVNPEASDGVSGD